MEDWRPVVGSEGSYEVSDHGRVRSLDREWEQIDKHGVVRTKRQYGKMLRPGTSSGGYQSVYIGGRGSVAVHILVAEAFIGPRPKGMHTLHNDGNPRNNYVLNLRYGTRKANWYDAKRHGTHKSGVIKRLAIDATMASAIKEAYATGDFTMKRLGRIYAVSYNSIGRVIRGDYDHLYD